MSGRPGAVRTERLDLVPGSLSLYEDDLASPEALGRRLGAAMPPGWPPGEHDRGAVEFFIAREREAGEAGAGWNAWYVVLLGREGLPDTVAGSIGYFGPPSDGAVEMGYSVVESFRGRGIATEAIVAMTAHALAVPGVARVVAHTATENTPSQRALLRAGFRDAGSGANPGMRRFERLRPA